MASGPGDLLLFFQTSTSANAEHPTSDAVVPYFPGRLVHSETQMYDVWFAMEFASLGWQFAMRLYDPNISVPVRICPKLDDFAQGPLAYG